MKYLPVLEVYKGLMVEVKERNKALSRILENHGGLGATIVRECAYLQLRMMCELVALGCVVAHDELTSTQLKRLRKTYHAAEILDALEKYHENFFPRRATRTQVVVAGQRGHNLTFVDGKITKAGLKKIWETCGRYLHKGTVNQLAKNQPVERDFNDVRDAQSSLMDMLTQHVIMIKRDQTFLLCDMAYGPEGKDIAVVFAEAEPYPHEDTAPPEIVSV